MSSLAGAPPLLTRVRSPPPLCSSYSHRLLPFLSPLNLAPKPLSISISSKTVNPYPLLLLLRHRPLSFPSPFAAAGSDALTDAGFDSNYLQWDSITAKFAAAANVPFLLLQLPQIVLNAQNLLAGNKAALFAVPWLGMLTGLLGNLSLLSYFAKKRETEAVVVQTLGVISTYAMIAQLAVAESMPLPHFLATSAVVVPGLFLKFLNYFGWLNEGMWRAWEDFSTIGGLSILPQVMWSTFVPFIPNSILPGIICCAAAVAAVVMAWTGRLSEQGTQLVRSTSGWTATLLFMWMPVAQMWTNYLNPDNIRGLSAFTMLLAMLGNGLMIPRALFIRDLMWFTGSAWASFLHGWGNLLCMYCFKSISKEFFSAATLGFSMWIVMTLWRDTIAYGNSSPMKSLKELVFGS